MGRKGIQMNEDLIKPAPDWTGQTWDENAGKMRETLSLMVSSFDAGMLPNKNTLEEARKVLAAVKRSPNQEPEPIEEDRVEKVAAVIERELMIDESLLADPATLRKIKSQRIARAALKAMEG